MEEAALPTPGLARETYVRLLISELLENECVWFKPQSFGDLSQQL